MRFIIVGSGLIGVLTAYCLRRHGHEVTVIDRQEGAGRETCFANGGMLTPSAAEPWNAPGSWRVLLASIGREDAALQLRMRGLPSLLGWGAQFLRNSNAAAFERNLLSNLRMARYSLEVMQSLRDLTQVEYGRQVRGFLKVFRDKAAFEDAARAAGRLVSQGLHFRMLSRQETVELEPALGPIADGLAGAIHYQTDETGDAYRFCVALSNYAERDGVEFRFGTEVSNWEVRTGRVVAALCGRERLVADKYIVAAGSYSTPLLRAAGIRVPVRPVKGYSVTLDSYEAQIPLRTPVVDDHWHAVVVPLEERIRVAGTAEFAGYDHTISNGRIANLLALLRHVLPGLQFDPASVRPWCGLRPMCVDGVPIIGPTPVSNLFVNTGHGHLGWTMAAGSAQMLADILSGHPTSIDPVPFGLARFG